jgi:hypothetical protein
VSKLRGTTAKARPEFGVLFALLLALLPDIELASIAKRFQDGLCRMNGTEARRSLNQGRDCDRHFGSVVADNGKEVSGRRDVRGTKRERGRVMTLRYKHKYDVWDPPLKSIGVLFFYFKYA